MMHLIIFGLENLQDPRTSDLALKWANRWVRSNWIAYNENDGMFEKYIATEFGGIGGGKEKTLKKYFKLTFFFLQVVNMPCKKVLDGVMVLYWIFLVTMDTFLIHQIGIQISFNPFINVFTTFCVHLKFSHKNI